MYEGHLEIQSYLKREQKKSSDYKWTTNLLLKETRIMPVGQSVHELNHFSSSGGGGWVSAVVLTVMSSYLFNVHLISNKTDEISLHKETGFLIYLCILFHGRPGRMS